MAKEVGGAVESGTLEEGLQEAEGGPERLLRWADERFAGRIALASSFGAEDVVLIDLWCRVARVPRVFSLDTGRLPEETYDVMERIRAKYGLKVDVFFPEAREVEGLVREHGANPFYRSVELRRLCCHVRKVEPLTRALAGLSAWISGLRREQAPTRSQLQAVEVDDVHGGILKLNPLVDWSTKDVWTYIRSHQVPYNVLHDRGYPSIGCAPCTRAIQPGQDIRSGRWWWENPETKECGLHVKEQDQHDPRAR
jgi:phosphoadenosine phosphosulfate reductase